MKDPDIYQQRERDLLVAYNHIRNTYGVNFRYLRQRAIIDLLLEQSAPRFYLTAEYAARYISAYQHDPELHSFRNCKMIQDLVATYRHLKQQYPNIPKWRLCEMLVNSPAPSFYMTHRRIREIIFNYKGRNGKE